MSRRKVMPMASELRVMKFNPGVTTLLPAVLAASLACAPPAQAQSATAAQDNAPFDVDQLFASTCGFCHSDGGRAAGKGYDYRQSDHDRKQDWLDGDA